MNVLVTGSTGFIGSALVSLLAGSGHTVTRLVRQETKPGEGELTWNPEAGRIEASRLAGTDLVVHLAGESISAGRWTARRKARIRDSRLNGTRLLSESLVALDPPPKVLASASAFGYYGDRGDETVLESGPAGSDFLADVTRQWELATEPAARAGIRVVNLRFAMVLDPSGGALVKMLPLFKLGLGGRLGSGKQYMNWIALHDALRAIHYALTTETLEGPVNVTAPSAVTNAEFTRCLGRALGRLALFRAPAFGLRLALGELAGSILASVRMEPARVLATGFQLENPELEAALRAMLART